MSLKLPPLADNYTNNCPVPLMSGKLPPLPVIPTPSNAKLARDGKTAPNSELDIGNACTKNKDFDPTINTDPTSNKHTKVPVSASPPFTYDWSPSELTQTAIGIGLSIGVWNMWMEY